MKAMELRSEFFISKRSYIPNIDDMKYMTWWLWRYAFAFIILVRRHNVVALMPSSLAVALRFPL